MAGRKSDRVILLRTFPVEVWLKIFEVTEADDLVRVYHSAEFFNAVLHPLRTKFLFSSVLPLVLPHLPKLQMPASIAKSLKGYLSSPTAGMILLGCRLVCRDWKKAVDNFGQRELPHLKLAAVTGLDPARTGYYYWLPPYLTYFRYNFENTEELREFENHFKSSHFGKNRNPIPSRSVDFTVYSQSSFEPDYTDQLTRVLQNCGHHIWYCHIRFQMLEPETVYSEIWRILELLPNLQILTLHFEPPMERYLTEVTNTVQGYPKLDKLKCIKVTGEQSKHFKDNFLSSNPHVTLLEPGNLVKLGIDKVELPDFQWVF